MENLQVIESLETGKTYEFHNLPTIGCLLNEYGEDIEEGHVQVLLDATLEGLLDSLDDGVLQYLVDANECPYASPSMYVAYVEETEQYALITL